jgi:adenine-specific DNA-methyltransferase
MPEVFDEGKIDFEKLKTTLGENINFSNERYVLNWAGKSDAFRIMQQPSTATLIPSKEESVDFDATQNIFIEGENMEVLKVLQKSYFGKVKMIYIDPPYNTGNDSFIYPDKFSESKEEYLKRVGDKDAEGYMTREGLFRKNSKENGQYHSNWLNMMMPRLYLAKNLLREDGVIFISIDDNEVHNLRLLMNEVFGEENFFCQIIIRANSRGQTYKQIAKTHEYLLVYTKNDITDLFGLEKDAERNDLNLSDNIGCYNIRELRNRNPKFGKHNRPLLFYPIYVNPNVIDKDGFNPVSLTFSNEYYIKVEPYNSVGKESCWRWGKSKAHLNIHQNTLDSNLIAKKKADGQYNIYEKYRKSTYTPKSIWDENAFLTETGTVELHNLGFSNEFDFPKPISLIKRCVQLATEEDDIILDFFAGSGTTAHAVMQLNKEDGGNRHFICIQLPELCDPEKEAYKAGYSTIAEISKERIRRAGNKLRAEVEAEKAKKAGELSFDDAEDSSMPDFGFKVFKLSDSNFKPWREIHGSHQDQWRQQTIDFLNPVAENASTENMVYELMLKNGKNLNSTIEHSHNCYNIHSGELLLLLESVDQDMIDYVLSLHPQKVIALDNLFSGNDQLKTNTALQLRDAGIIFKAI